MVAFTAIQWVLIVAAGSITTAGVGVGIWLAVLASNKNNTAITTRTTSSAITTTLATTTSTKKTSTATLPTTITSKKTSTATVASTTTTGKTSTRSEGGITTSTNNVVTTSPQSDVSIEQCGQNAFYLANSGRFLTNIEDFFMFFVGPTMRSIEATKYKCCDACTNNLYCYLFEYITKTGDCIQYGYVGTSYDPNAAYKLLILDTSYSSGFFGGV